MLPVKVLLCLVILFLLHVFAYSIEKEWCKEWLKSNIFWQVLTFCENYFRFSTEAHKAQFNGIITCPMIALNIDETVTILTEIDFYKSQLYQRYFHGTKYYIKL